MLLQHYENLKSRDLDYDGVGYHGFVHQDIGEYKCSVLLYLRVRSCLITIDAIKL